jgi:hypothetical protein
MHDHGSEYTGPLLSDDNDRFAPTLIEIPWLDRREDGYWLKLEVDTPAASQPTLKEVPSHSDRPITESMRRKCKHRIPNVGKCGAFKPLD